MPGTTLTGTPISQPTLTGIPVPGTTLVTVTSATLPTAAASLSSSRSSSVHDPFVEHRHRSDNNELLAQRRHLDDRHSSRLKVVEQHKQRHLAGDDYSLLVIHELAPRRITTRPSPRAMTTPYCARRQAALEKT